MGRLLRTAMVACGILALGGTVAWATGLTRFGFVGGDGTIQACVKTSNGNVRFIDPSSATKDLNSCRAGEVQVSFNQQGQKGDPGPQGPQGPPGSSPGPANVTVDCAAGQSVQQALNNNANATSLDITIKGTCTESVNIFRDRVSLHVASSGDGLAAPASNANVLTIAGGRYIQLAGLTLTGGGTALSINGGAFVNASGLSISGVTNQDVAAGGGSSLFLNNATIDGGNEGVSAQAGGSVSVNGGTIANVQSFAVHAHESGSVTLDGGVVVSNDGFQAVVAQDGGSVLLRRATVQGSAGTGVFAFQGGSVFVTRDALVQNNHQCGVIANAGAAEVDGHVTGNYGCGVGGYGGGQLTIQDGALIDANNGDGVQAGVGSTVVIQGVTIANNTGNGVHLTGTSSAAFNQTNTITGNGQWGIFCDGPPSVAQIQVPPSTNNIISGNSAGQISCPES